MLAEEREQAQRSARVIWMFGMFTKKPVVEVLLEKISAHRSSHALWGVAFLWLEKEQSSYRRGCLRSYLHQMHKTPQIPS